MVATQSSVHKNHEQLNAQSFLKIPAGSTKHRAPFKFGQPHNTQSFAKPGKSCNPSSVLQNSPGTSTPDKALCSTRYTELHESSVYTRALCYTIHRAYYNLWLVSLCTELAAGFDAPQHTELCAGCAS